MGKSLKPIVIMTVCILVAVGIFSAIAIYDYRNVPEIDVSESPFGIRWGTPKDEAESMMAALGHEKMNHSEEYTRESVYTIYNYQSMEGVSGCAVLNFDEALKLEEVILDFRSPNVSNGLCGEDKVELLCKSLKKSLNTHYKKMSYNGLEDYEYWQGENVFVTVYYQKPDVLTIAYSDNDSVAEYAEELAK